MRNLIYFAPIKRNKYKLSHLFRDFLKIVVKNLEKLNCSYGKVSHDLNFRITEI